MDKYVDIETVSSGLGFDRVIGIPGSTYRDNSTVVVVPMRGMAGPDGRQRPMIHYKVGQALASLVAPMNQKKALIYTWGNEVGQAYDEMIRNVLASDELSKWKYVLTIEDDNLPLPDAHLRLIESIESGPYDAVSGIYFTKGEWNMPMAYGDPEEYRRTGTLDFKPRDIRAALAGGHVMPVNGIAMGCALWRMDLFRQIAAPWFVTVSDWSPTEGGAAMTQDLSFCKKAVLAGKRFAVDFRVRVGHLDVNTEQVY